MGEVASYADSIDAVAVSGAGYPTPPYAGQRPHRSVFNITSVRADVQWTGRQTEDGLLAWRSFIEGGICLTVPNFGGWFGIRRAGSVYEQTGGCAGLYDETVDRFGSFIGQFAYEVLANPTLVTYVEEDMETRHYTAEFDLWNADADVPRVVKGEA